MGLAVEDIVLALVQGRRLLVLLDDEGHIAKWNTQVLFNDHPVVIRRINLDASVDAQAFVALLVLQFVDMVIRKSLYQALLLCNKDTMLI